MEKEIQKKYGVNDCIRLSDAIKAGFVINNTCVVFSATNLMQLVMRIKISEKLDIDGNPFAFQISFESISGDTVSLFPIPASEFVFEIHTEHIKSKEFYHNPVDLK